MTIAAIYSRKSTEQNGVADEQKSVARQVEHAREYAVRKGWTVDDGAIFIDDGISGAEFSKRPGFLRLMNALKPQPAFQVLVMSEESRLGREQIETAYALKQLLQAGVRVFFYLEDRERTFDSPTDKLLMSVAGFVDEMEREKARQRTADAMVRKARAGHVTGGRVFGYDNIPVLDVAGQRSHVERRINDAEAVIIQRIFQMCAAGQGVRSIAKLLNADGARAAGTAGTPGGLVTVLGVGGFAAATLPRRGRLEPDPKARLLGSEASAAARCLGVAASRAAGSPHCAGGTVAGGAQPIERRTGGLHPTEHRPYLGTASERHRVEVSADLPCAVRVLQRGALRAESIARWAPGVLLCVLDVLPPWPQRLRERSGTPHGPDQSGGARGLPG